MKMFNNFKLNENNNRPIKVELSKEDILNSIFIGDNYYDNNIVNGFYYKNNYPPIKYDYNGDEYIFRQAFIKHDKYVTIFDGWFVFINNELKYTLFIYEPFGIDFITKRNLIISWNRDVIINYWLDNNDYYKINI